MKLVADWLTAPATCAVMDALSGNVQTFFVGGSVRNTLLGAPVSDIDIATDAHPEEVTARAEAAGLKAVPTGLAHGTVTLVAEGVPFEVTTFRRDVETDGRRAVVAFTDVLEEDAARRDFTMNALYADRWGDVCDPVGGLPDLEARRVRFIGNAGTRIREDALRILRFFRFQAWYGQGEADAAGLSAIAARAYLLEVLSAERITSECIKLLVAPDPTAALAGMANTGVLDRVLPGADLRLLPRLLRAEEEPDWITRALMIGTECGRLRLSTADEGAIAATEAALMRAEDGVRRALRYGAEAAHRAAEIEAAILHRKVPDAVREDIARCGAAEFPLKAADLMPPLSPGPDLGAALARLREDWIQSGAKLNRAALLERV